MSRPWMPLYVADYLRDTRKLTAAEHGAYLLLIMEYWTAGTLPDDDRQLARIASMSAGEWKRARPNVEGFFHDGWKHKRLDAELARSAEISSKRAASAKQRHSNSSAIADQVDTHAGATSQPQLKKDAAPAALRVVPEMPPMTSAELEKSYFDRGKIVLGSNAGGILKNLLKAKENNVALARAAIEQASVKSNPREYIGAVIRGPKSSNEPNWLDGIPGII